MPVEQTVTDPKVLRALAHPLRGQLLGLLRTDGPSTATRLAARVGHSSGLTSYHLRQLAQYGLIDQAPDRESGRERWWQARHQMTSWEPDQIVDQPGGLEANRQMQRRQVDVLGHELRSWMDAPPARDWARVSGLSDYVLRLTPAQTREVLAELYAVLDDWADRETHPQAGPVNVFVAAFPRTPR